MLTESQHFPHSYKCIRIQESEGLEVIKAQFITEENNASYDFSPEVYCL
jgi:hypothetical protein